MQSDLPAYELEYWKWKGKIDVEFQKETVLYLCKWVGALLGSGTQSRVIPLKQLVYVLEDTSKYWVAVLTEMALRALKNASFEITVQRAAPFFSALAVLTYIIDGLPPASPPCSCRALVHRWAKSRCRDQRGARAADLRAVRSCFFSCTLPSANKDHLALAQKLKRTCRESFFPSLSGYSVVASFLFNVLLVRWLRNAELCLAELTAGVRVFHHCPPLSI